MWKMTTCHTGRETRLFLKGELAGDWIDEFKRCQPMFTAPRQTPIVIDLTDVSSIDEQGKTLLVDAHKLGVRFEGGGPVAQRLLAEINS